ncbi:hypothetical protein IJ425_01940 [bacterium]|nr:hypothetical protein [bacterium]
MDKIKLLTKGQEANTYCIHYSSSGFYDGGAIAPTICCIAMTNLKTGELHTFALQNYIVEGKCLIEAEKQLLTDFANFYNSLKNPILVHWRMNSPEFGFKAINARCENYGICNLSFLNSKNLDLDFYIYLSLSEILKRCDYVSPYLLYGKIEADFFNKRNYNAVKLSTEAKSLGINSLLKLIIKDKLDFDVLENS